MANPIAKMAFDYAKAHGGNLAMACTFISWSRYWAERDRIKAIVAALEEDDRVQKTRAQDAPWTTTRSYTSAEYT